MLKTYYRRTRQIMLLRRIYWWDGHFGDRGKIKIIGKGTVHGPNIPKIKNVLLVKGVKNNLLSVGQMYMGQDFKIYFSKSRCKVYAMDKKLYIVGKISLDNYYIMKSEESAKCNITTSGIFKLWQ